MEAEVPVAELEVPEKKAWSALHGAWGKRPAKQANNGQYYSILIVVHYIKWFESLV